MQTRLPAPALVILIGPSGSGKTTWAFEHFRQNEVVSSDSVRAMVGIDENDQRASPRAFEILETVVNERLSRRLTTVIDTTGLDDDARVHWISLAHDAGIPAFAVMFPTPTAECLRRNATRSKPIPKSVVARQATRFATIAAGIEGEGFDGVLDERPVTVVPPQMVERPAPEATSPARPRHSFGLTLNRFDWPGESEERAGQLASIASRAEKAGFRDLWVMDHFRQIPTVGRPWEEIPEAYTTLAFLAANTSTIRLGTLVTGVTYRNPALLGKMIATLDVLSGGRAICGIGAARDEEEHHLYGWDFPTTSERYDRLEDTLRLLPLLWGKGAPDFTGKTIRASSLVCYPRPIQTHIPILVGGGGERRTLRLVAEYADACNVFGSPDRVRHKVGVLGGHCEAVGRDLADIEVTHLISVLAAPDPRTLRTRIDEVRPAAQSPEEYARRHNAAPVEDLCGLFEHYRDAGASHSIVAIPDVHLEGSIEAFADVIAKFDSL